MINLDIYKKALTLGDMKNINTLKIRSTVGMGLKLSTQLHRPKKGPGSYKRSNRISND